MKEQKRRSSKTIDIASYALEVSVNGCVCIPFQVIRPILKFVKCVHQNMCDWQ